MSSKAARTTHRNPILKNKHNGGSSQNAEDRTGRHKVTPAQLEVYNPVSCEPVPLRETCFQGPFRPQSHLGFSLRFFSIVGVWINHMSRTRHSSLRFRQLCGLFRVSMTEDTRLGIPCLHSSLACRVDCCMYSEQG